MREIPRINGIRKARSFHEETDSKPRFARILHSQGKFALTNRKQKVNGEVSQRSKKLQRLANIFASEKNEKSENLEQDENLLRDFLANRQKKQKFDEAITESKGKKTSNADRVRGIAFEPILFKSKRKFDHFKIFEKEEQVFDNIEDFSDQLYRIKDDEDVDSDKSDVRKGVNRTEDSLTKGLTRVRPDTSKEKSIKSSRGKARIVERSIEPLKEKTKSRSRTAEPNRKV